MFHNLGNDALEIGDYERAANLYEESLSRKRELGDRPNIARTLATMGVAALWQGDCERATRLEEDSLALAVPLQQPHRQEDHEALEYALRAALCEEARVAAWAEGPALSPDDAIALALQEKAPPAHDTIAAGSR